LLPSMPSSRRKSRLEVIAGFPDGEVEGG
jgi:hypothetical protein